MIICADDYGEADDINRATLELVNAGRLSAVSCMVALPRCGSEALKPLLEQEDRIDLGLHLTFENALRGLSGLFKKSLSALMTSDRVAKEIAAQYDRFVALFGRRPDFIDGHLHAHEFPGIADSLLEFMAGLPPDSRPYARNTHMPLSKIMAQGVSFWKCAMISIPGRRFRRKLELNSIATNHGFSGVYDYRQWRQYPKFLRAFVQHMESANGILMVHPGFTEDRRRSEFEALRDADFPAGAVCRFRPTEKKFP
jgi:chitin disaccharide deacetylase